MKWNEGKRILKDQGINIRFRAEILKVDPRPAVVVSLGNLGEIANFQATTDLPK